MTQSQLRILHLGDPLADSDMCFNITDFSMIDVSERLISLQELILSLGMDI